eukprot:jgi/Hompol1/863/HPOL_002582-RA
MGACSYGSNCQFSHEAAKTKEVVCPYYLQGKCQYGTYCRLPHKRPSSGPSKASPSQSSSSSPSPSTQPSSTASSRNAAASSSAVASQSSPGIRATISTSTSTTSTSTSTISTLQGFSIQPDSKLTASAGPVSNQSRGMYAAVVAVGAVGAPAATTDNSSKRLLCPFALKGICKFGSSCRYIHGLECPSCHKLCLHPDDSEEIHADHIESCMKSGDTASNTASTESKECVTCPICRQVTYLVVPSSEWPQDAAEKERIVQEYRARMGKIDCRHFDFGNGTCPFSTSCLYRHADRHGNEIRIKPRYLAGADDEDGIAHAMSQFTLYDFLSQYDQSH